MYYNQLLLLIKIYAESKKELLKANENISDTVIWVLITRIYKEFEKPGSKKNHYPHREIFKTLKQILHKSRDQNGQKHTQLPSVNRQIQNRTARKWLKF